MAVDFCFRRCRDDLAVRPGPGACTAAGCSVSVYLRFCDGRGIQPVVADQAEAQRAHVALHVRQDFSREIRMEIACHVSTCRLTA